MIAGSTLTPAQATARTEANWAALHKMVALSDCRPFMFMGMVPKGDRFIYLYKHSDTRRYLNVDQVGQCYAYMADNGAYAPIAARTALNWVFS